jgi:uncharacterized repeat protein (TIGR03803 family)
VILDSAGNLYGTAGGGTSGDGIVYELGTSGTLTVLHSFIGTDGKDPAGGVIRNSAGILYGTTNLGGTCPATCNENQDKMGVLYELATSGTLTVLHQFAGKSGENPLGGLIQDSAGNFYGTTQNGGTSGIDGSGVVYKLTP